MQCQVWHEGVRCTSKAVFIASSPLDPEWCLYVCFLDAGAYYPEHHSRYSYKLKEIDGKDIRRRL